MYLDLLIVGLSRFDTQALWGLEGAQVVPPGRLDLRPHHEAEERLRVQEEVRPALILRAEDMVLCLLDGHVLGYLLLGRLSLIHCQGHGTLGLLGECILYFGAIGSNKLPLCDLGLKERTSNGLKSLEGS